LRRGCTHVAQGPSSAPSPTSCATPSRSWWVLGAQGIGVSVVLGVRSRHPGASASSAAQRGNGSAEFGLAWVRTNRLQILIDIWHSASRLRISFCADFGK